VTLGLAGRAGSFPTSTTPHSGVTGGRSHHSSVAGKPLSQVLSNGKHLQSGEFVNKERKKEN